MSREQDEPSWYRVLILVDDHHADRAAALLWDHGASGVEVRDSHTFMEESPSVPEGKAELVAFFSWNTPTTPSPPVADVLVRSLRDSLRTAGIPVHESDAYKFTDTSWATAWKAYFRPTFVSPRVIVGPPWETFEAPQDGTRLIIEPGMAFGTGTHETTKMCAAILDQQLARLPDSHVLDVGCGSAILSMCARRLGAQRVVGVDHDATAVDVALENLRVNDLEGQIDISTTPLADIRDSFDIVVANILTHILLELRDDLRSRVRTDGLLVLSGITADQIDRVLDAFEHDSWPVIDSLSDGEWRALVLFRSLHA